MKKDTRTVAGRAANDGRNIHEQPTQILKRKKTAGPDMTTQRDGVAARAQGWMPMIGGPELSTTARTPALNSVHELAGAIAEVHQLAAEAGRRPDQHRVSRRAVFAAQL